MSSVQQSQVSANKRQGTWRPCRSSQNFTLCLAVPTSMSATAAACPGPQNQYRSLSGGRLVADRCQQRRRPPRGGGVQRQVRRLRRPAPPAEARSAGCERRAEPQPLVRRRQDRQPVHLACDLDGNTTQVQCKSR